MNKTSKKALPSKEFSQSVFQTIFKQSPISTQIFTPEGKTLAVNHAWEKLWRVKLEDMEDFNILTDKQLMKSGMIHHIKKGFSGKSVKVPPHMYEPQQAVKGSKAPTRWIQDYIYPVKDKNRTIMYVVMQHEDITDQKIAEEKLKQSEEFNRAILEHSSDAISLIDTHGNIVYSSPSRKNILGYSSPASYGHNALSLVHPDDLPTVQERLTKVAKVPGSSASMTFRIRKKNGKWIWIDATGTNLLKIPYVEAIAVNYRDVTNRHEAEEKLIESETRFRKLFESNILGLFMSTYDGRFIEGNDAFLQIIGYSRKELTEGKIHRDKLTPKELQYLSKNAVRALNKIGSSNTYEKEYIRKDGSRVPVLIAVTRIGNDVCMGYVVDISERKELEKRKDDFISMASHELKTPITSMKLFVQILEKQLQKRGDKETIKQLEKMDIQINKLTRLVQELLDISRINAGKMSLRKEVFNVNTLVDELVENVSITTTHNIIVKGKTAISIRADRDRIGQVLLNLLTNAIKYSPNEKDIIISTEKHNHEFVLSVQDFGKGIPKEEQKKIFDRFYQVAEKESQTFPGLGMGLYISYDIVKLHHGTLTVNSTPSKGSIFTITLPLE